MSLLKRDLKKVRSNLFLLPTLKGQSPVFNKGYLVVSLGMMSYQMLDYHIDKL